MIARTDLSGDARYLVETICEQQVIAAFFAPSLLAVFVHDKNVARCASLRCANSGGEAIASAGENRFYAVLPGTELFNGYGPTEAVIAVTAWRCEPHLEREPVPIGRPIANTRLYILEGAMKPVPAGLTGELYIGGVQVARGYLARPELTAKAFVPDPLTKAGFTRRAIWHATARMGRSNSWGVRHEAVRDCVAVVHQGTGYFLSRIPCLGWCARPRGGHRSLAGRPRPNFDRVIDRRLA